MKTYLIKDNMCVPYKLILSKLHNYLVCNGWQNAASADLADVYIVGCCGAFHSLEAEALGLLRTARQTDAEVIAFGCLPRIAPEAVQSCHPDRTIPSTNWELVADLIETPVIPFHKIPEATEFWFKEEYRFYDPTKQFVFIQTGCSSNCPYCPHKLGIGELKSRPLDEILYQVSELTMRGVRTIVLHGNDTGSYGTDLGNVTYPELLKQILRIAPDLHLSQINADWAYTYREELFSLLLHEKIKEFQVLIQTVSDRLLVLMNRKPVVGALYDSLKQLRLARPDILLRTDIMIGYPTATVEEEEATLAYVAELFDEVAVHGFERFSRARIETMGLPFYSQDEIDQRVEQAVAFLKTVPNMLIHRGGQIYQTLVDIEHPKEALRVKRKTHCAYK